MSKKRNEECFRAEDLEAIDDAIEGRNRRAEPVRGEDASRVNKDGLIVVEGETCVSVFHPEIPGPHGTLREWADYLLYRVNNTPGWIEFSPTSALHLYAALTRESHKGGDEAESPKGGPDAPPPSSSDPLAGCETVTPSRCPDGGGEPLDYCGAPMATETLGGPHVDYCDHPRPCPIHAPEGQGGVSEDCGIHPTILAAIEAEWDASVGQIHRELAGEVEPIEPRPTYMCSGCKAFTYNSKTWIETYPCPNCGREHYWTGSFVWPVPPEPTQEPVAWIMAEEVVNRGWDSTRVWARVGPGAINMIPLYASPPVAQEREAEEDEDRVAGVLADGIYIGYPTSEASPSFVAGENLFDTLDRIEAHFTVPHGATEPTGSEAP